MYVTRLKPPYKTHSVYCDVMYLICVRHFWFTLPSDGNLRNIRQLVSQLLLALKNSNFINTESENINVLVLCCVVASL